MLNPNHAANVAFQRRQIDFRGPVSFFLDDNFSPNQIVVSWALKYTNIRSPFSKNYLFHGFVPMRNTANIENLMWYAYISLIRGMVA